MPVLTENSRFASARSSPPSMSLGPGMNDWKIERISFNVDMVLVTPIGKDVVDSPSIYLGGHLQSRDSGVRAAQDAKSVFGHSRKPIAGERRNLVFDAEA